MKHRFGVFGTLVAGLALAASVALAAEFRGMGLRVQFLDMVDAVSVRVRNGSTMPITVTAIHVFVEHQGAPLEVPVTWAAACVGQTVGVGKELRCRGAADVDPLGATTAVIDLLKADGTSLQIELVA